MANDLTGKKVAFLGAGKMGSILLQALLRKHFVTPSQVHATVQHADKAARLSRELGVTVNTDNPAAVAKSDMVVLAVGMSWSHLRRGGPPS